MVITDAEEGMAVLQDMDAKIPVMIMLVVATSEPTEHLETIYANPMTTWNIGNIERRECVWPEGVPPPVIHKRWENKAQYLEPVEDYDLVYTPADAARDALLRAAYEHGFKDGCAAYAGALEYEGPLEDDDDE